MVEVDLATMSQARLRDKVRRYLAYAADREWQEQWPHCPPLLLLTTTEARARTFVTAAARVAETDRRGRGMDYRWAGYGPARREVAAAERLVIAACGLVRAPAAAVTDPVWLVAADDRDTEPAPGVRLVDLLAERVAAQHVADGWWARRDADQQQAHRAGLLAETARDDTLPELLGPGPAAAYRRLLTAGAAAFADAHPELAEQVMAWRENLGQPGDAGRRQDLSAVLAGEQARLLAGQIRRLLAAPGTAGERPAAAVAAAALAAGQLVDEYVLDRLDAPGEDREQLQQRLLAEHAERRQAAVDDRLQALGWWARRATDPAALADDFDRERLLVCDMCALVMPAADTTDDVWHGYESAEPDGDCPQCRAGRLLPYADREQIPTLADRLTALRTQLPS